MKLTSKMLHAATSKAVELGILPRRSQPEDVATNVELMQEILQAALDAASEDSLPDAAPEADAIERRRQEVRHQEVRHH
jgi:hypothetical protein